MIMMTLTLTLSHMFTGWISSRRFYTRLVHVSEIRSRLILIISYSYTSHHIHDHDKVEVESNGVISKLLLSDIA